ncbi:hypothetical protein DICPUDRAFT_156163 [Dictyostelium purpureum]|uniref:TOG domain-containing protein n=1 Tax=Dictyostelium purpureum TaxID=5786 RepID=F0ZVV9_DICPU|nr:uncharacterized protein DICPUDRAFT_156163 [Dictyostelium purpureum]EGC31921.1 hypothetical protein DICPUDRAFT_156163 [Dictyostelium purpureum]|eukprot:XP_003291558.1 hypothetical protein DICPUDRAFT_156163 [Dictyostelium purpureum]
MADEETPSGSIEDRISHKNWKWRVHGLEELTNKFKFAEDSSGPLYNEWGPQFKKILADINPIAQEKSLETLNTFIDRCDCVSKFASGFAPVLVEKVFASSRPRAKDKAIETLMATMEADAGEPVVEALLKGTTASSPKIILASLLGLTTALKTFGPKQVQVKLILKQFAPWFENRDKNIRDQASELFVEIYRWINKALLPLINDTLTPIQLKALQEQFEKLPSEPAVPLKYTRSEAAKALANAKSGVQQKAEVVEEIDPYSLMSAVNILSKLGAEFYEGLQAKKWQERSEQMDKLTALLQSAPKIEPGDYTELSKALKKILADANVIIMTKSVVAIGLLAEGLRNGFSAYSKQFIAPLLDRFREKKASIVLSIHTTLDSLTSKCINFPDIIDEVTASTQSKVAQVKQETLTYISNTITNTKKPQDIVKLSKQLAKIFMETLNDTNESVRDASSKAFAALGGVIGERGMTPYLNQLDPIKAKKVKDNMPEVSSAPAPIAPTPTAPSVSDLDLPSAPGSKKAAPGKRGSTTPQKEDVKSKVSGIVSQDILDGLGKANWKDRLVAVENLLEKVKGTSPDALTGLSESIISTLADKPGWKEGTFQVLLNVFSIIIQLTKLDSSFNQKAASLYLAVTIEKLSDVKLKDISTELLFSTAEAVSPQVVYTDIFSYTSNHKNPKVINDALNWIQQALDEFGILSCVSDLKGMVTYAKGCLENSNPDVKKSAVKVLCTIRVNVGSGLSDYLSDLKKLLFESMEKEFAKVADQKPPTPTRQWKGMPPPDTKINIELPRTDISAKITPTILANLNDNNWKTRSDALDEIEKIILEANRKIQPKIGQLPPALKNRLPDTNQKVQTSTLNIITLLSQSMGAPFEKAAKLLIPQILLLLQDLKKPIRDATISCMNQLLNDFGFDIFVPFVSTPMILESSNSRKESLSWTAQNIAGNLRSAPVQSEMNTIAKGIVACLQDKAADIRSLADNLLSIVCTLIPAVEFKKELKQVKPANQPTIQNVLDKYYQKNGQPIQQQTQQPPAQQSKSSSQSTTPKQQSTPSSPQPQRHQQPIQQPTQQPIQQQQQVIQSSNQNIIIYNPNGKIERQETNNDVVWYFEEINDEVNEILQDQVLQCFTHEFANMMFSTLPSISQNVADQLTLVAEQNPEVIVSVLDILFRWISFKLFDTSVNSLKRILRVLDSVLNKLISLEYSLNDYEATCIIPILIEKTSCPNAEVKQTIKQLIPRFEEICPPNILIKTLLDIITSKNWRTRVEMFNLMASIIDKHGASVCGDLREVVPLIAESLNDSQVKHASIQCLSKIYLHIKDSLFKCYNFTQTDRALIINTSGSGSGSGPSTSSNQPSSQTKSQRPSLTQQQTASDPVSAQLIGCLELLKNYHMTKENGEHIVEALKQFSLLIENQTISEKFMKFSEEYFSVLTSILSDIFPNYNKETVFLRACKYLTHTIISIYSNLSIAKQCNVKCLDIVLNATIRLYNQTESNQQSTADSEWFSKAFNQILLRTLQNSNSTILFTTLLRMMTRSKNDATIPHPEKYNDFLLRCLLRATKSLKTNDSTVKEELDVGVVLSEINSFLEANASLDDTTKKTTKTLTSELYQSKTQNVISFSKNILAKGQHQKYQYLLGLLSDLLTPHKFEELIGVIPTANSGGNISSSRDSFNSINITSNLDINSPVLAANTSATTTSTTKPRTSSTSTPPLNITPTFKSANSDGATQQQQPVKAQSTLSQLKVSKEPRNYSGKSDQQKKELLQEIFKKIGNKDLTSDGIYDLYYFLKEYPDYDITPNLNSSSQQFQAYIHRNLKKAKDAIEGSNNENEVINYHERLKIIQNTFYNQHNQANNTIGGNLDNHNPQLSNTASMASNTLNRLRSLNSDTASSNTSPSYSSPSTTSSSEVNTTIDSLKQRLAKLTQKSND